ncbi:purine-nucleoside phosphorylase [Campylobacter majalis]|uniref:purine-nucleoside phosphorylase n=1 Tax=Campylobacter majalis TaxID=2790656 RepID=UPI003D6970D3
MKKLIVCAGESESFDFAVPIGIGLVQSGINLSEILTKLALFDELKSLENSDENLAKIIQRECEADTNMAKILADFTPKNTKSERNFLPSEIIFIGSAGLYQKGELFEIFESKNAANIEISLLDDKSYVPVPQDIFNDVSQETFINSSNFITKNKESAKKLFELGAYAENMEFFAVLATAQKFGIDAKGIFVATNFCDTNAHTEFVKNHALAKDILHNYLEEKGLI